MADQGPVDDVGAVDRNLQARVAVLEGAVVALRQRVEGLEGETQVIREVATTAKRRTDGLFSRVTS